MEALRKEAAESEKICMVDMFKADPERAKKMSFKVSCKDNFLYFDYSKNLINDNVLKNLYTLAEEKKVPEMIEKMFNGEKINMTEKRAVLHIALRNRANRPILVDGKDVMKDVNEVLEKMKVFSEKVRSGEWKGYTGKAITDVINIGIGGSDLGPQMVSLALTPYADPKKLKAHYISNVDGSQAAEVFKLLNPETCLFIISSKTFTTLETMANAKLCKEWWLKNVGAEHAKDLPLHFVAVSTNLAKVAEFGIDTKNTFAFWDWVGGRFSLWSAIGLSTCCYVGYDNFVRLLEGGFAMDEHFYKNAKDLHHNLPATMALVNVWNSSFLGCKARAVLPYDQYLSRFPAFLQQLEMESNGKHTLITTGEEVDHKFGTECVVFGEAGTNGQHAFYQQIHQGTQVTPCDFIFPLKTHNPLADGDQHRMLAANVFAQAEALMKGKTYEEAYAEGVANKDDDERRKYIARHRTFSGNRPSNMIILNEVTPESLGMLIALYEHKVFVEGIIWGINSFDQMGVELGKQLCLEILPVLRNRTGELSEKEKELLEKCDGSTKELIRMFRESDKK